GVGTDRTADPASGVTSPYRKHGNPDGCPRHTPVPMPPPFADHRQCRAAAMRSPSAPLARPATPAAPSPSTPAAARSPASACNPVGSSSPHWPQTAPVAAHAGASRPRPIPPDSSAPSLSDCRSAFVPPPDTGSLSHTSQIPPAPVPAAPNETHATSPTAHSAHPHSLTLRPAPALPLPVRLPPCAPRCRPPPISAHICSHALRLSPLPQTPPPSVRPPASGQTISPSLPSTAVRLPA